MEINIQEILNKYDKVIYQDSPYTTDTAISIDDAKLAIKEIITEVLKEAADNALLMDNHRAAVNAKAFACKESRGLVIYKESITSTINKVKF